MPSGDLPTVRDGIRKAIYESMSEDPSVICIGLGVTDPGAVFGTTSGLLDSFGADRVFDGPTSENGMTGVGVGAAIGGLKPVMSHQRLDFFLLAMDQLVNSAAKWRYMFGGQVTVPLTIRLVIGRGWGQGPTHSQNLQSWFAHVPGLKVIAPTTPGDAYGLLKSAIADPNPVVILEHRWMHGIRGNLAQDRLSMDLHRARIHRFGSDVTIVATGPAVIESARAADWLQTRGLSCEVIDLRAIRPIDWETICTSVIKTRRLVVCDPAQRLAGISAEIVAGVSEECWSSLACKPERVTLPGYPEPTSVALTRQYHVSAQQIAETVLRVAEHPTLLHVDELANEGPHDQPQGWQLGPF